MTDEDIIARIATLWGVRHHAVKKRKKEYFKPSFIVTIRGFRAVSMMRALRDLMGARRKGQIDAALRKYDPRRNKKHWLKTVFSPQTVNSIRMRWQRGETLHAIAKDFGVSHETIRKRIMAASN